MAQVTTPQPTTPQEAPKQATGGDCEQEIAKYNWDYNTAVAVAKAESGLRSDAIGDTTLQYYSGGSKYGASYGCFQIRHLPTRPSPEYLLDATNNVQYAYELYKSSGWSPWSAFTNGSYRRHL